MKVSDNDLFRLQDGEPPKIINPDWDIETVITSMATELLELRAEVAQQWISVKDRLPGIGEEVLIVNKFNEIGKGWYSGEYGWSSYDSTLCDYTATHWMPLPEPPEEV